MRDYFLQQLGIGEVWKLRTPAPDASAFAVGEVAPSAADSALPTSPTVLQSRDLALIYRHPEDADDMLQQDSARLSAQLLAALNFNQSLKIHPFALNGESIAPVTAALLSLRPRAVLVLGGADACRLLSLDSATVPSILRQGNHCLEDIPVIVTHELVSLLHQPALKRELWMDMCRVKNMFVK